MSLFDNSDSFRNSKEFIGINSSNCNVFVNVVRTRITGDIDGPSDWVTKYCGKNNNGEWIESTLGEGNLVFVYDVTRDGKCALVSDRKHLLIYEQTDEGLKVSPLCVIRACRLAEFSPDGTRVVLAHEPNGIKVYNRNNRGGWQEEYFIPLQPELGSFIWTLQFSTDGTTISFGVTNHVEIYGRRQNGTWSKEAVFDFDAWSSVSEIIFSPDGTHGVIKLYQDTSDVDPENAQRIIGKLSDGSWVEKAKAASEDRVAFSPDGTHVAVYSDRYQRVILRELNDGPSLPEVAVINQNQKVRSVQFSDDGSHVVTGSNDGLVRIWGVSGNQRWIEKAVIEHDKPVHLAQFAMETTHVLACCENRTNLYELKPHNPSPIDPTENPAFDRVGSAQ